jgi:PPK2 family polyphosphate:nucleotide phosphotransferase
MDIREKLIETCRVPAGERVNLNDYDPGWTGEKEVPKEERKQFAKTVLTEDTTELAESQERLYAGDSWSILILFQGMDASGKDGTIKHVMSGINPQGVDVRSFKHPSTEELDHDFLWRYARALPERGRIGIFNRSYFEDVLVVKVHPELVAAQRIPGAKINKSFWEERYEDINNFERHLIRNGTVILKFFLNLSKDEQRRRFLKRLEKPEKHWKFNPADLAERQYWDDYMAAFEDALSATSTKWAPWYIIPADHKWVTRAMVALIIADCIRSLDLSYPEVTPEMMQQIEEGKKQLEGEEGSSR